MLSELSEHQDNVKKQCNQLSGESLCAIQDGQWPSIATMMEDLVQIHNVLLQLYPFIMSSSMFSHPLASIIV